MDFNELLSVADYNRVEANSEASIKMYSTVPAPPKKPPKSGVQSENIRRFLEKKKAEEDKQASLERKKKKELLELRAQSTKNNKKAKIMASRTKDNDFSKIKLTEDEIESKKKREELLRQNLMNTKERMKARIEMEELEKSLPRKRKRKSKLESGEANEELDEREQQLRKREQELMEREQELQRIINSNRDPKCDPNRNQTHQQNKAKRPLSRPAVPQMSFQDLLKVAEVKQHEKVELPKQKKEEERLLTKKERKQMLEEQERIRRRQELRQKGIMPSTIKAASDTIPTKKSVSSTIKNISNSDSHSGRAEKCENVNKPVQKSFKPNVETSKSSALCKNGTNKIITQKYNVTRDVNETTTNNHKNNVQNSNRINKDLILDTKVKKDVSIKNSGNKNEAVSLPKKPKAPLFDEDAIAAIEKRLRERMDKEFEEKLAKFTLQQKLNAEKERNMQNCSKQQRYDGPNKMQSRTIINNRDQGTSSKREALSKYPQSNKNLHQRKPVPFHKNPYLDPPRRLLEPQRPPKPPPIRRIESDDDDDDDDDMSDFIDDRPSQNEDDYSKYIKEIFGYDKSRYLDEDDDEVIESSYADQMREEVHSAKVGYQEDLEEERKEREELKRKSKKKLKK